jgi:nitrogen fixation protein FixH
MSCCGVFIMPYETGNPQSLAAKEPRTITGRFVLMTFIAFFGVIFAVNAVMMTLAIRTMPGLDVKNGYVASQAMNKDIVAMRLQAERGWKADVTAELKNRIAIVGVNLIEPDGKPVIGLKIVARLAHPAITTADHSAFFIEHRPGIYSVEFPNVQAGAWTVLVEAQQNGERVFASRNRVLLKEAQP